MKRGSLIYYIPRVTFDFFTVLQIRWDGFEKVFCPEGHYPTALRVCTYGGEVLLHGITTKY